ncbi:DUF1501 domain-containing protein [bacterium]|nr:DUF1501 domain-containing protein [bacterium]
MLKLFPTRRSNCETPSRRDFMVEVGSISALGLALPHLLQAEAQAAEGFARGDVNCIFIWTRGGTSHHDTLDPKPNAGAEVRGDFGVIDTALPGIQFTDQMPNFARELNRYTVMRNLNPKNGSHSTADAIMMSGRKFNPAITYPCYGSVVSKELGPKTALPPFIQLGTNVDQRFNGGLAGYLGLQHNAFVVPGDPSSDNFTVRDVSLPNGLTADRMSRRRQALQTIDTLQRELDQRPDALQAIDAYYENAFSMITSAATKTAFDLSQEDQETRDAYGKHNLGQSCLLARRLIEAGTRFVTVSSGGWDTHRDNFNGLKKLLPPLDQAWPALLADLEDRGLLANTFVFWLTDFGRTPIINSAAGRDHWSTASIACFAGAGVRGGQVLGQTDETGAKPVGREYYPEDIAATVYSKLGIPLDTHHTATDGRPIRLCIGEPVPELMS